MSFVLYDEDMAYLLVHRCPGAASVPLFWGPDRASGQVLTRVSRAQEQGLC